MRLPSFIVIGAMKAGTTSLYHYLDAHPAITMTRVQEPDFFLDERRFARGVEWYASLFDTETDLYGETSPNYTKYPRFGGVPKRMAAVVPEAKLVYVLRDPVERIVSHYVHNFAARIEARSLEAALTHLDDNHYVACSRYHLQLQQYLPYYPLDRFHFLTSEALLHDRTATLQTLYRFLGADDTFTSPTTKTMHHRTAGKRRKSSLATTLTRSGLTRRLYPFVPKPLVRLYHRTSRHSFEQPVLSDALRIRLVQALQDDVMALRHLTGLSFEEWSV